VSPVYVTHDGYRHLYWVSSPASTHAGNVAADGRVAMVAPDEPADACAVAFAGVGGGAQIG